VFILCLSFPSLDLEPQVENTLGILNDLIASQLALTIQTVDERDRNLSNSAAQSLCADHKLHLETVSFAFGGSNRLLKRSTLVQSETTSQVAHARAQNGIGEQVGAAAHELALEIPAENTTVASIAGAGDDIVVALLLESDHLRDELGVMREVGVHDDDEVAGDELETVDVGRAETKLAGSGLQEDVWGVDLDELLGNFLGSIGGSIVDNDEFPVEVTTPISLAFKAEMEDRNIRTSQ
jgi:hypothetical protein